MCLCACLLLCGAASGTGSTPPDAVSRGAFADALYDAHVAHGGAPVVSEGSSAPFRDVGSWSPYFEALCWAKASGIAGGYAGGAFRPAAPVTRQQATVMLYRYTQVTDRPLAEPADLSLWQDADSVPDWCREAVAWAVGSGLWYSGSSSLLKPGEPVTAEELTVLMDRLFAGGMEAVSLPAAPEGLTMELQSCSTTGAAVLLKNETEETFSYGASFGLYRQVNGGWYALTGEMAVIAILYQLAPGQSQERTFSWGGMDWGGVLPEGTYCVSQAGTLGEEQPVTVSAVFAIR